jgi:hypothetical protein
VRSLRRRFQHLNPLTRPQPGPGEVLVSIVIGRACSSHSLPS